MAHTMCSTRWSNVVITSGRILAITLILLRGILADRDSCTRRLSLCDCTITSEHIRTINCTSTGYLSDSPLGTLIDDAPYVQSITFTGNNVPSLSTNLFGECHGHISLSKLTYLDLSSNNIQTIQGKTFHCVTSLTTLILNDNNWLVDPDKYRVFSSIINLKSLHLDNAFASKDHLTPLKSVFSDKDTPHIEELHLARNFISYMDDEIFCDLKSLKRLYLSHNRLSKIGLDPKCNSELEEIYLDDNNLMYLSQQDISILSGMQSVATLDLRNNPFDCRDCTETMAKFRDWLKSDAGEIVIHRETLVCEGPPELEGKNVVDLTDGNMEGTCDPTAPYPKGNSQVTVIALTMSFLGIVIVVVIVVFVNRERIQADGCWAPLRDGTRKVLRNTLQFRYSSMDNDTREIIEEEMGEEMNNVTA